MLAMPMVPAPALSEMLASVRARTRHPVGVTFLIPFSTSIACRLPRGKRASWSSSTAIRTRTWCGWCMLAERWCPGKLAHLPKPVPRCRPDVTCWWHRAPRRVAMFAGNYPGCRCGTRSAKCSPMYDQYLERWTRAEARGLEGIFFSEHHFTSFNLSPSPNLLIAAVAQRTNRLRLGVMCNVVHLHDARRLAEECAMLDYLTHGRFEIGVGAGGSPLETIQAGLDPTEIRARYASGLAVLEAAKDGPLVTRQDAFVRLDNVPIRPRPRRQPVRPSG